MNPRPNSGVTRFSALVVVGLAALTVAACTERPAPYTSGFAIENVSVIDVVDGEVGEGRTVVVEGDRIVEVASASSVRLGEGVQRVDGSGRYLIPGLWDMHAHAYLDEAERLERMSLAFGVTGVREMGTTPEGFEALKEWRRRFRAGEVPGPRLRLAGVIVDGEPPTRPHYLTATNPEEAREAVGRLQAMGADLVKVYGRLPTDAFHAIAEEARGRGLEFSGHWPTAVGPAAASDAGITTLEHADDLGFALSDVEPAPDSAYDSHLDYILERIRAFARYDERKAEALIGRLTENGTIFVPTLHTVHTFLYQGPADLEEGALSRLLPEGQKQRVAELPADAIERHRESFDRAYENLQRFVEEMHEAGVVLMAGSHAPATPFIPPGWGLHEELVRLAEVGLTPVEALRTATLHPARYLDRLDDLGTVENGKLADLVLLDANPLDNIRHTRRIHAVVVDGRLLDRDSLDAMLDRVRGERKN